MSRCIHIPIHRQIAALLLVALLPALVAAWVAPRSPSWAEPAAAPLAADEISWEQLAELLAPTKPGNAREGAIAPVRPLLIDARAPAAYEQGHIPGALSLAGVNWEEQLPLIIAALAPGMPIIVYCDDETCGTSRSTAERLRRELAHEPIYILKGGWRTWLDAQKAGKP